jgi:signal transduction histidine kinase
MIDYRQLFECAPARLLVLGPETSHGILGASNAYLEATLTTRDILSRPLFDVFPDNPGDPSADGVTNLGASLERAMASRGTDVMPVQKYDIRDRSGHFVDRYWAPINASVVAGDGTLLAIVHRVEDVTSFVKEGESLHSEAAQLRHEILVRSRDLALANAKLRDSVEQRRRIVAIVGHDLRGPLASVSMSVGVLRRRFKDLGAIPPSILDVLESNSARMQKLLNDLDDYTASQLDGRLPVHREHANLRAICEEVVLSTQVARPDRVIELAPGENVTANVDPGRTQQLLANLIHNAVSYGAADRPVRVSLKRVTGACVLTVSNEGEPIPEDVIPSLFQPFRRGRVTGSVRQRGHLGLGLFIVQQIAQSHDATIDVESTPQGTHFSVYIPVP